MDGSNVHWAFVGLGLVTLGFSRSRIAKAHPEDDGTTADLIAGLGGTCVVAGLALWVWPYVRP